ncbi:CD209 antigen-like protein C [Seriola dumerili]|uniref:CD209 antigen-like protein C n=1 Tax=Seriola dumerili TaxID=41447 RepID=A0A3B4U9Z4_SERDU|nr:CD209 antigen-like protein C [Seriola dumerili]
MGQASENIYVNENEIRTLEPNRTGCVHSDAEYVTRSSCRAAAAFLGLLCILLVTGLITLVYLFTQGTSEWNKLHNNLTKELDQLQTSFNNLAEGQNQLQKRFEDMNKERKGFQRKIQDEGCYKCWRRFGSSYYYISTEKKAWDQSREECLKEGADLVIINSEEEQQFLIKLNKRVWIGLTDQDEENVWKWVDGTTPATSYWQSLQPDNAGNEDCVEIRNTDSETLLKWNDLPCSYENYWVCEAREKDMKDV